MTNGRDNRGRFLPGNRIGPGSKKGDMRNLKYPWRVYFRRRKLPPKDRWILGAADNYLAALVSDKGGEGDITAGERRIAEIASAARVAWMLAWLDNDKTSLGLFMQIEMRSLKQIGLDRRARDVTNDLQTYLDSIANSDANGAGQGE